MEKIFTVEYNYQKEHVEIHLDKKGASYLMDRLRQLIEADDNCDDHLMTPYWGGNELTSEQQNMSEEIKLINHLKLLYRKEK
jgi:hypothetical protein